MRDLLLAIVHHLLIFGLFGVLLAEFIVLRPGISAATASRVASLDLWYGLLAAGILIVGFSRAIFAAKGWGYYSHNAFFWAKIAAFAAIGLLSLPPTFAFLRWRRRKIAPDAAALKAVRVYLHVELALFALLLIFAALMARGYGEF
jgi:putative membrane protein